MSDIESIVGIPEPWSQLLHEHQLASALPHQWPGIESTVDQAVAEAAEKGMPNFPRTISGFVAGASDFAEFLHHRGWRLVHD